MQRWSLLSLVAAVCPKANLERAQEQKSWLGIGFIHGKDPFLSLFMPVSHEVL